MWSSSVIRVGVAYVNVNVLRYFKEELAWAVDKRLWLIIKVARNYSYVASTTAINNAAASQLPAIKLITR